MNPTGVRRRAHGDAGETEDEYRRLLMWRDARADRLIVGGCMPAT